MNRSRYQNGHSNMQRRQTIILSGSSVKKVFNCWDHVVECRFQIIKRVNIGYGHKKVEWKCNAVYQQQSIRKCFHRFFFIGCNEIDW